MTERGESDIIGAMSGIICPNCCVLTVPVERCVKGIGCVPISLAACELCGFNTCASMDHGCVTIRNMAGKVLFTHVVGETEMDMSLEDFSSAVILPREEFWSINVEVQHKHCRMGEVLANGGEVAIVLSEKDAGSMGGPCLHCHKTPAWNRIEGDSNNGFQCQDCWERLEHDME